MKKRLIVQGIAFIFFTVFLSRYLFEHTPGYVVALSPTLHLGNIVALLEGRVSLVTVLPAFILLIIGLCYKRFFCFWLCPLGFLQDIIPSLNKKLSFLTRFSKSNYFIFLCLFLLSLFSLNMLGFFDPLTIYARLVNAFQRPFPHHYWWFLLPVAGVVLLNIVSRRAWCFHVCPLGTFFDWSRDMQRRLKKKETFDVSKRNLLKVGLGGILVGIGLKKVRSSYAEEDLIRPPGAFEEATFKNVCIRCGNCIKACITDGLQPTFLESGWDGLFTPRLIPRIGECDEYCRRCGIACPTGAIKSLTPLEKHEARLGIAYVNKSRCLGWQYNKLCFICGEVCPYLALERYMKNDAIPCPVMREYVCRGCGLCENECPTHAIKVYRSDIIDDLKRGGG